MRGLIEEFCAEFSTMNNLVAVPTILRSISWTVSYLPLKNNELVTLSLNFNLSLAVFLKAWFFAHYYFLYIIISYIYIYISMILITAVKFQISIYL